MKIFEDTAPTSTTLGKAPRGVPLTTHTKYGSTVKAYVVLEPHPDNSLSLMRVLFLDDGSLGEIPSEQRVRVWANSELTLKP